MPMTWTADAPPYLCTNCGFWQRHPGPPPGCPVCLDPRHVPPSLGWRFWTRAESAGVLRTELAEVQPDLWRLGTGPQVGIGGNGYLLRCDDGNVLFDCPAWVDDAALEQLAALGGVRHAAASHPHTYGALWQVQARFGCELSVGADDIPWTAAFTVTWPLDRHLRLAAGLDLYLTAGHFPGHAVLHDARRRILLSGDALKLDLAADGRTATAISCHKGYVRGIPLSHDEIRRYRDVLAPLAYDQVWTPFEQGAGVDDTTVMAFLDHMLATRPSTAPVPIREHVKGAAGEHAR